MLLLASTAVALPPGSYRDTCKDITVEHHSRGDLVVANCEGSGGAITRWSSWNRTSLWLPCDGDIINFNGKLRCEGSQGGPRGSYRKTCKDIAVEHHSRGDLVVANCVGSGGAWNRTSLWLPCDADIMNSDGKLRCEGPGAVGPRGSYRSSCKDIAVEHHGSRGDLVVANCYRKNDDRWSRVSLWLPCDGDIANDDGKLTCKPK
jgi:hypothetical protein